jgi:Flp pilus assembly protein TadD
MAGTRIPLTPEIAMEVLSGARPLRALLGVDDRQVQEMAAFGHELWRQGRRREAESVFRGLVAIDEKSYFGHAGLGLVAMSEDRLEIAEEFLRKAVELEPSDPSVVVNLGEVLLRQGKVEAAVATLDRAARLDPTGAHPGAGRAGAILRGIGLAAQELSKNPVVNR